ncbi:putative methyltransferase-domain-containing protein [Earliella scabrosa]|nr:putative methyltransferase-domain-containing protein [Earliella scabrosa]
MAARHPVPPTSSLPPLARLSSYSLDQLTDAVHNVRSIYRPTALTALPQPKALPKHVVHDTSVPDSGYASAEGEDDSDDECDVGDESFDIDVLRSDTFEREFAIRWLTGFAARSDMWVYAPECSDQESDARAALVDEAASLLSTFAGADEEEAITRVFTFPTRVQTSTNPPDVRVELNDAPLLSDDHTSVGLQSWGSAIRLAELMCLDPGAFGIALADRPANTLRILELGAGTGLLSIAAAKLLASSSPDNHCEVVATDYHPSVLDNLRKNVETNFLPTDAAVQVLPLDWQNPVYEGPLAGQFRVILAADVVYHPGHARWIKSCVERLLECGSSDSGRLGGVFWLIIPLRSTGRHEGMSDTVEAVFPHVSKVAHLRGELAILHVEELRKQDGVGRADEGGYKLYQIGWA